MDRPFEVALEPLDAAAFASFGQIVGAPEGAPVFTGPHIDSWRLDFAVEGGVELMFTRYHHQAMVFTRMERHTNVTQAFLPLGCSPSVMVVATTSGAEARPTPETVRAFYVPGDRGIMLWRGTWHALTRFPVHASGAAFALITGRETQAELEREARDGTRPRLTEVIDFAAQGGSCLVVDPAGLLP